MALSEQQKSAMRSMSVEQRKNLHISRMAESLENIEETLRDIRDHLRETSGSNPLAK